jgi:hypothetical protein
MTDEGPAKPLSPAEAAAYRAKAAAGETPSLDIVRRFIATIRKTFAASPAKTAKAGKTRNAKPKPDESQMDFF